MGNHRIARKTNKKLKEKKHKKTLNKRQGKKDKKKVTRKARGLRAQTYTDKSILLKTLNLEDDIKLDLLEDLKKNTAATMIQSRYINKGKKNFILRELIAYESIHDEENMSIHFNVFDPVLANILDRAARMNFIRSDKNAAWINILGRIYFGLNELKNGGPPGLSVYYNRIEDAFFILVKKILNVRVNREDYLEDDRLYELLIEPLIR